MYVRSANSPTGISTSGPIYIPCGNIFSFIGENVKVTTDGTNAVTFPDTIGGDYDWLLQSNGQQPINPSDISKTIYHSGDVIAGASSLLTNTSIRAQLQVQGNVLIDGSIPYTGPPKTGSFSGLMYLTGNSTLLSGASGGNWNNIGINSIISGNGCNVDFTSNNCIVTGNNTTLINTNNSISSAINSSTNNSDASLIIGDGHSITGSERTIISGLGNNIGYHSDGGIIAGRGNTMDGDSTFVIGDSNTVEGDQNSISGAYNNIFSNASIVCGYNNTVGTQASIVDGRNNNINGGYSITNGEYNTGSNTFQSSIISGSYNNIGSGNIGGYSNHIFGRGNVSRMNYCAMFGNYGYADPTYPLGNFYCAGTTTPTVPKEGVYGVIYPLTTGSSPTGAIEISNYLTPSASDCIMMHWLDGNSNHEDRIGYFVKVTQGKLEYATSIFDMMGVTSSTPSKITNTHSYSPDKILRDELFRPITETDQEFNFQKLYRLRINELLQESIDFIQLNNYQEIKTYSETSNDIVLQEIVAKNESEILNPTSETVMKNILNENYSGENCSPCFKDKCCSPMAINGLIYVRLELGQNIVLDDRIIPGPNGKGIKSQNNLGYLVVEVRSLDSLPVARIMFLPYETALMKLG